LGERVGKPEVRGKFQVIKFQGGRLIARDMDFEQLIPACPGESGATRTHSTTLREEVGRRVI